MSILESFTDILLYWFPFYFFLKTVFLIWLMVPTFNVRTSGVVCLLGRMDVDCFYFKDSPEGSTILLNSANAPSLGLYLLFDHPGL